MDPLSPTRSLSWLTPARLGFLALLAAGPGFLGVLLDVAEGFGLADEYRPEFIGAFFVVPHLILAALIHGALGPGRPVGGGEWMAAWAFYIGVAYGLLLLLAFPLLGYPISAVFRVMPGFLVGLLV